MTRKRRISAKGIKPSLIMCRQLSYTFENSKPVTSKADFCSIATCPIASTCKTLRWRAMQSSPQLASQPLGSRASASKTTGKRSGNAVDRARRHVIEHAASLRDGGGARQRRAQIRGRKPIPPDNKYRGAHAREYGERPSPYFTSAAAGTYVRRSRWCQYPGRLRACRRRSDVKLRRNINNTLGRAGEALSFSSPATAVTLGCADQLTTRIVQPATWYCPGEVVEAGQYLDWTTGYSGCARFPDGRGRGADGATRYRLFTIDVGNLTSTDGTIIARVLVISLDLAALVSHVPDSRQQESCNEGSWQRTKAVVSLCPLFAVLQPPVVRHYYANAVNPGGQSRAGHSFDDPHNALLVSPPAEPSGQLSGRLTRDRFTSLYFDVDTLTPKRAPPPIKANRVPFPKGSPWFSHVGIVPDYTSGRQVFSGISHFPPYLHSGATPYSPRYSLIGFQNPDVKTRPKPLYFTSVVALSPVIRGILGFGSLQSSDASWDGVPSSFSSSYSSSVETLRSWVEIWEALVGIILQH
ncbi:hypothetical protein PR048_006079 [Dryococelus australis]|uniref:Uncharacterized protein n=1 Tax=Dryococelus australis TaxID=614101 RepID=A0ABQ9IAY3_9NEOP|nr:hypothetical protein PR048_006079 [Dryococelus australis]